MQKLYLKTLILFLFAPFALAQIPGIEWKKCYGGSNSDAAQSIKATPDGGYIMTGTTQSSDGDLTFIHGTGNDSDIWVLKIDAFGEIEWQKSYGGSQQDSGSDIELTSDGGYIIAGRTYSSNGDSTYNYGAIDAWIVKIAADGTLQWQKTYGSNGADTAYHIQQTQDGGYIFCGYAGANNGNVTNYHGSRDAWVVKITSDGTLEWQKTLGGTNEDYAYKVIPVEDGYLIGCETLSGNGDVVNNHGGTDFWVVKLNQSGLMQWNLCYGSNGRNELNDIIATPDGGYIMAGNTAAEGGDITGFHNPGTGNFGIKDDYWIAKISANGLLQWQKCYGGSDNDVAVKIANTPDGGYIIIGYSDSNNGDNDSFFTFNGLDYWVVKIDGTGAIQWQETYGGSQADYATDIIVTPDGGYLLTGFVKSTDQHVVGNHGSNDFFVVKLLPEVLSERAFAKGGTAVYPNPATDSFQVQSDVAFDKIELYDLQGRKILEADAQTIDARSCAAGTYILKATLGGKPAFTQKIVKR